MRKGSSATGYKWNGPCQNPIASGKTFHNSPHQLDRNIAPNMDGPTPPPPISACKDWTWAFCRASRGLWDRLGERACSTGPSAWTAAIASNSSPSRSLCNPNLLGMASPRHREYDSIDPSSAFRENRTIAEHFSQNAADWPNVDRFRVALRVEHDFRRTIPSRRNVFRQESSVIVLRISNTCKTKITNLKGRTTLISLSKQWGKKKELTFKSHVVFNSRLLGFKSLCSTLAECMYLRPRKIWYRK